MSTSAPSSSFGRFPLTLPGSDGSPMSGAPAFRRDDQDRPPAAPAEPFVPREPDSIESLHLLQGELEALVLKTLLNVGTNTGRKIANQLKLPFGLTQVLLRGLKEQMLVAYRGAAEMNDYEYELTDAGMERGRHYAQRCTYFGAAPVSLEDYVDSVVRQSVKCCKPRVQQLKQAFGDLALPATLISQVGQALHSGRALFLYGNPGNGKTTIAERIIRSLGQNIWIPRTLTITGEIIRLYDPSNHEEVPLDRGNGLLDHIRVDRRWVRIKRPTIVVGGELTLGHLEITHNPSTAINEAPLQLKANGGVLVVDDFGRQRISTAELLNRWIIPLEKGHDYLTLPSGRQIQVPFDPLLVFATNLEPKQIVDEAFLRRIPYKIQVFDPSEDEFRLLFRKLCPKFGLEYRDEAVTHLIEKHFHQFGRPLRYCQPRDLLQQVKNLCEFHECPLELTNQKFDVAVHNYFAGL